MSETGGTASMFIASTIHQPGSPSYETFRTIFRRLRNELLAAPPVSVDEWQSQAIDTPMRELLHVIFEWEMPEFPEQVAVVTGARMPWAEDHFRERVSGLPLNPAPSEAWWPFAAKKDGTNVAHKSEGEAFSHTYPERMWPKYPETPAGWAGIMEGIRFEYGDASDVVNQLIKSPNTRQAYLPIWFPEDTGAVHGKRVPCTLGYHFIIRDGQIDCSYFMRSTDLLRHFQDDVYLAVRLVQWIVGQLREANPHRPLRPGKLIFHTANLHIFDSDVAMIEHWDDQGKLWF
ncbi:MAG: thymidylate synthase [Aurantimicrobium sp.]|uniref:thymidylate synthase n=1 Tax=Aurantimicrobium sp. TaxID=1930784 RepID=UPI002FC6CE53